MGTWCDEYREIVSFYFWEPQHLGRTKKPDTPYKTFELCWMHVAGMEVALNHLLNIYFAMVPLELLNERAGWVAPDSFRFLGTLELEPYEGFSQPDLMFRGSTADCAMELKVGLKMGLLQVQKYVLLQALTEPGKPLSLLVITPHSGFAASFQEGFESPHQIASALRDLSVPQVQGHAVSPAAYQSQVDSLQVLVLSYEDLASAIRARLASEAESCVISRNAHSGVLVWLHARGLIKDSE